MPKTKHDLVTGIEEEIDRLHCSVVCMQVLGEEQAAIYLQLAIAEMRKAAKEWQDHLDINLTTPVD